jgi:thymidylate kinase
LTVETLRREGARVTRVEVPCRSAGWTHCIIYWMLRNGLARRLPNLFQTVQFLNKLSFQLLDLPDLLRDHDVVVLDRWSLSSIIYGDVTGVHRGFNRFLARLLRKPDRTVVFTERSYRRSSTQDDSYEKDTELQAWVREGYREWALTHADHFLVDNTRSVEQVHRDVIDVVCPPCPVCKARFGEHCDAGLHS